MSVVGFLKSLLDAGLSLEDAMKAAAIHEEAMGEVGPRRSKGAERQARYEERKRQKASETSETVSPDDTLSPSPPPRTPPPRPHTHGDIYTPARGPTRTDVARGFLAFWQAYPKRAGKDAAGKAFAKAMARIGGDDPLATIMAGLERALPGWDDPQFIPHPATWLNQGRWDDDAPAEKTHALRPTHGKPDKLAARHENYADSWTGAERAVELMASRRALGPQGH